VCTSCHLLRVYVTCCLCLKIVRVLVFSATSKMDPIVNPILPVNPCIATKIKNSKDLGITILYKWHEELKLVHSNLTKQKTNHKKYKLVRSWLTAPPFQGTKVGFVLDCRTCLTTMRVGQYQRSETTIRQVEPDIATTIMLTRGGMMLYPEARHPQSFRFSP
jgi:hypothetical protein